MRASWEAFTRLRAIRLIFFYFLVKGLFAVYKSFYVLFFKLKLRKFFVFILYYIYISNATIKILYNGLLLLILFISENFES